MDSNKQDSDDGHCGVSDDILHCAMNSLGWLMPESEAQVSIAEAELSAQPPIALPESLSTFESFLNSQTHRRISHHTIANFDSGDEGVAGGVGVAGGAGAAGVAGSLARAARSGAELSPEIEARMAADRRAAESGFDTE